MWLSPPPSINIILIKKGGREELKDREKAIEISYKQWRISLDWKEREQSLQANLAEPAKENPEDIK